MISRDYTFIIGKIRALETRLPDRVDFDRMLDAKTFEQSFQVLNDSIYGDYLLDLKPHQYPQVIEKDLIETKYLLEKYIDDENVLQILFTAHDWQNVKIIWKQKLFSSSSQSLNTFGLIDSKILEHAIENNQYNDLPKHWQQSLTDVSKQVDDKISSKKIDAIIDKAYLKQLKNLLPKRLKKTMLNDYVKLIIDQANIRFFIRSWLLNQNKNWLIENIVEGGEIAIATYKHASDSENLDEFLEYLKQHTPHQLASKWDEFINSKDTAQLESILQHWNKIILLQTKQYSDGFEVIIEYWHKKLDAAKNIRLILSAKRNNIANEKISNRLQFIYL